MAGNDWINSYLEAILDVGPGLDDVKSSLLLRERGRFSPTRYFVEEVITGFDETDLHRSWIKVYICFSTANFIAYPYLCVMVFKCVSGSSDEESQGEEYEVGEYVLEDLELGSSEEAGLYGSRSLFCSFWYFCNLIFVFV